MIPGRGQQVWNRGRGKGGEENINLLSPPFPLPLFQTCCPLPGIIYCLAPTFYQFRRALFPRKVSSLPLQNTSALQARLFLTPCKLSFFHSLYWRQRQTFNIPYPSQIFKNESVLQLVHTQWLLSTLGEKGVYKVWAWTINFLICSRF